MLAIALRIVLVVGGIYLGACVLLWAMQDSMIFHPRPLAAPPGHPSASPIEVAREGATLRGWVVNGDREGPLIVYFGGNAEEVSGNIPIWANVAATVVLMNYRGFGESTGAPSERHLVADAKAVARWARDRFPNRPLVLFGMSLGSGIAALAAAEVAPVALIVVSPYRSVEQMARDRFPMFPIRWMLRHPFDAASVAERMPRTLAFASPPDRVIPFAESAAMVELLGARAEFHIYPLRHNAFLDHPPLWREVSRFLAPYAPGAPEKGPRTARRPSDD